MIPYKRPDTVELSEKLMHLLCDSMVGDDLEDFNGSDDIEW